MKRSERKYNRELLLLLKELHLPMFREYYARLANQAVREDMSYSRYLYELALKECEVRRANNIRRLIKTPRLPLEKTFDTFDMKRLPLKLRQQVRILLEVLFTLLAHRYERGSLLITSNLPFSKWETIFKDPMTTAAAIDRLVHHSVILEFNVPGYRAEQAKKRKKQK